MNTLRTRMLLGLLLLLSLMAPGIASAQSRSLEDGPAIRRQLLHRSAKLELQPGVSAMFGNAYQIPLYGNLTVRYHLSNRVSVGADLNGSPWALDRAIVRNLRDNDPQMNQIVEVADTPFVGSFQFTYSPIVGKLNMFNQIQYFDVHLIGGAGGALQSANYAALGGFKFGAVVGIGLRLFVRDSIALNVRFVDYLYSNAEAYRQGTSVDSKFRQHYLFTAGVSFFFPKVVYVSR